jgi:four helix bundle protein
MESYKELEVWQKAISLVVNVYQLTKNLPPEEKYGLVSQMQRAAVSIPSNIAEGWGRGSTKEFILFLSIARGSLWELETLLLIVQKLNYLSLENNGLHCCVKATEEIGKMINGLMKSLKNRVHSKK